MKKPLNLLCGVIALYCFASMFVPLIAPRVPAGARYLAPEAIPGGHIFAGDHCYAQTYWSIRQYFFSTGSMFLRILLTTSEALLICWAYYSLKGEAGRMGLAAAVLNLTVDAIAIVCMLKRMEYCQWGTLVVLSLNTVGAVALAAKEAAAK